MQNNLGKSIEVYIDIDSARSIHSIAVLENQKLVNFFREDPLKQHISIGSIVLGRVATVQDGLNAAFVDVYTDSSGRVDQGFLAYTDIKNLEEQRQFLREQAKALNLNLNALGLNPERACTSADKKISDIMQVGDWILCSIIKEPWDSKKATITTEIAIPGHYIIWHPFSSSGVKVTGKADKQERKRLNNILKEHITLPEGAVVRTASIGKDGFVLINELNKTRQRWQNAVREVMATKLIDGKKAHLAFKAPSCIYPMPTLALSFLQEYFDDSFTKIFINDRGYYDKLKQYISEDLAIDQPHRANIVKYHKGPKELFKQYDIYRKMRQLLSRKVSLGKGAHLVIERTEAMHVIDVNSGRVGQRTHDPGETAKEVNRLAAEEIARQLIARDIGGIIIIDFIDMRSAEDKKELVQYMEQLLEKDRAQPKCLPLSKNCLMEITRKRTTEAIELEEECCPSCLGTGRVGEPSIVLENHIEEELKNFYDTSEEGPKPITIEVHPFMKAYLTKGLISIALRWKLKYSWKISISSNADLPILDYVFYDATRQVLYKHHSYHKLN